MLRHYKMQLKEKLRRITERALEENDVSKGRALLELLDSAPQFVFGRVISNSLRFIGGLNMFFVVRGGDIVSVLLRDSFFRYN